MRIQGAFLVAPIVLLAGCASSGPRVQPVPESAWHAADGSTRTSYPTQRTIRPDRPRPEASARVLTKEDVLALASHLESQEVIAEVDRHPLAFPLDDKSIGWFEDRLAPPEVVDYLKKRGQVNWDQLSQAPPEEQQPRAQQPMVQSYDPSDEAVPPPPQNRSEYATPSSDQPTTVYVEGAPRTTVVYETSPYYDSYYYGRPYGYVGVGVGVGFYGGYYYSGHHYRDHDAYYPRSSSSYGYGYGRNNPVVVSTPGGVTTYRASGYPSPYAGSVYRPAPAAGLYSPRGFQAPAPVIQTRMPFQSTRGNSTVTVTRQSSSSHHHR